MRRGLLLFALLGFTLTAGCGADGPPQVTASAGDNEVTVPPLQYCAVDGTRCTQDGAAAKRLTVSDGDPVRLAVDGDIADAPWRVEYRTTDDAGHLSAGCSPLFAPGKQDDYQVPVPSGQHLQLVNVYQLGARLTAENHDVSFGVRGTWTVLTTPQAAIPKPGEVLCPDVSR